MFTKEERLFIWEKVYEMIDRLYEIQRSVASYDISCNVWR